MGRGGAGTTERTGVGVTPRRGRVIATLALVGLAPITGEFSYGYMDVTGDLWGTVAAWIFFLPLYGGAALLIREVSVRLSTGWWGRLLWGAAFGLAMTALIDLSLFTREHAEISFWADVVEPTRIEALGISVFPLLTWVLGHVVLSTAAPIALVESLAGRDLASRPWVGRPWLVVMAILFLGIAALVRVDEQALWGADPSVAQTTVAALGCLGLLVLGLAGARLSARGTRGSTPWPPWAVALLAGAAFATTNSLPSWWGTAMGAVLVVVLLTLIWRWSAHAGWSQRHVAAAGYGPVLATVLLSFATPPAEGTTTADVLTQASVLTVLTLLLGLAVHRRTRQV